MDRWHVLVVAIGAGFVVSTIALLLHFKADLGTALLPIGAFVALVAGLFTKKLGGGDAK